MLLPLYPGFCKERTWSLGRPGLESFMGVDVLLLLPSGLPSPSPRESPKQRVSKLRKCSCRPRRAKGAR